MTRPDIPLIDMSEWRAGDAAARRRIAERTDAALQDSGFLMVSGHGIPGEWMSELRAAASAFFALPAEHKAAYATHVGGRGWIPSGKEANSLPGMLGDASRPDLKESYTVGREYSTGDTSIDESFFRPNIWPAAEVPEFESRGLRFMEAVGELYLELLEICAVALDLDAGWFQERARAGTRTMNINRYPPLTETGAAQQGQFRVGPHTDWGVLTILDRQAGYGGLQVETHDGSWVDAPTVEGALTVNIGDLLARWTADRWRSTRHRVLPPSDQAPDEELISLIVFLDADVDALIEPFGAPIGRAEGMPAVTAGEYLRERAAAATVA